jgi:hypothetical protein
MSKRLEDNTIDVFASPLNIGFTRCSISLANGWWRLAAPLAKAYVTRR